MKAAFTIPNEEVTDMEDKKIVDLYWERDENAIKETSLKYGRLCPRGWKEYFLRYKHIACRILTKFL